MSWEAEPGTHPGVGPVANKWLEIQRFLHESEVVPATILHERRLRWLSFFRSGGDTNYQRLKKIAWLQEIHLTTIYSAGIVRCCECDTRVTSE